MGRTLTSLAVGAAALAAGALEALDSARATRGRSSAPAWLVRTTRGGHGALYGIDPFGGNLVGPIADLGEEPSSYGHYAWASVLGWHR